MANRTYIHTCDRAASLHLGEYLTFSMNHTNDYTESASSMQCVHYVLTSLQNATRPMKRMRLTIRSLAPTSFGQLTVTISFHNADAPPHDPSIIELSDDDSPRKSVGRSQTEPTIPPALHSAKPPQKSTKLKSDRFHQRSLKMLDQGTAENHRQRHFRREQQDSDTNKRIEDEWFSVKFQTYIKYSRWEAAFGSNERQYTQLMRPPVIVGWSSSPRQGTMCYGHGRRDLRNA